MHRDGPLTATRWNACVGNHGRREDHLFATDEVTTSFPSLLRTSLRRSTFSFFSWRFCEFAECSRRATEPSSWVTAKKGRGQLEMSLKIGALPVGNRFLGCWLRGNGKFNPEASNVFQWKIALFNQVMRVHHFASFKEVKNSSALTSKFHRVFWRDLHIF